VIAQASSHASVTIWLLLLLVLLLLLLCLKQFWPVIVIVTLQSLDQAGDIRI
jgi:hypothetical protein